MFEIALNLVPDLVWEPVMVAVRFLAVGECELVVGGHVQDAAAEPRRDAILGWNSIDIWTTSTLKLTTWSEHDLRQVRGRPQNVYWISLSLVPLPAEVALVVPGHRPHHVAVAADQVTAAVEQQDAKCDCLGNRHVHKRFDAS